MKSKQNATERLKQIIGHDTYPVVADRLNKEGYKTPQGKKWNKQHIATWAFNQRKAGAGPRAKVSALKQLSAGKKLAMIKQIVLGLHQS